MDLIDFRLFRKPRLGAATDLPPAKVEGKQPEASKGKKDPKKYDSDKEAETTTAGLSDLMTNAREWKKNAADPLTGEGKDLGETELVARAKVLRLLADTDAWLARLEDRPKAADMIAYRTANISDADDKKVPPTALPLARTLLCDWLLALWILRGEGRRAVVLTRRLLILDLLDAKVFDDAYLNKPSATYDALHRRDVIMPQAYASSAAEPFSVELVRGAKVDDLYVVRSEWSCYKAGEIASITNILAGESFVNETKEIREEEIIEHEDQEVTQSTEKLEEERTQTELSKEIEKAASLQVGIEGSFDVSGQYGVTKFGAAGSASTAISLSENNSLASKTAREMVSKAVSKVESRVRQERTRRLLTRTENTTTHTIGNDTDEHRRGVYRWVDRVDRYQIFRYPNRLLLEFQIPEPATYLRYRLGEGAGQAQGGVEAPPAFSIKPEDIQPDNYGDEAVKYRASNLPAPPDQGISVSQVIKMKADPGAKDDGSVSWVAPLIQEAADIALPSGYVAEKISVSGSAYPMRQLWRVEPRSEIEMKDQVEGFHRIVAYAYAGDARYGATQDGTANLDQTVQLANTNPRLHWHLSTAQYKWAVLSFDPQELALAKPAQGKVMVGMHVVGASSASFGFTIECRPSDQTMAEWRLAVYDCLLDAWRGWDQQYRTQQLNQGGPNLSGANSRSPLRNKELVQEELKRQVITWLLDKADFNGINAMTNTGAWNRYDIDKARQSAPLVQFFEQAFEWGNLTFMLYDYFWARGNQWDKLADIEAADPEFARFLRSGSARVVLPARPGFEDAVSHWLAWGEPFLGEPVPLPGDPMYVSIATEIRDIKDRPAGGIPCESWETRMGTTLLWLDPNDDLPLNDARQLGRAPNEPKEPICTA